MPSSCVCLCVCLSHSGIKTAKRRITQITPHNSPLTLVFWCQSSLRNSNKITPYGGDKCRWGGLKFVTVDEKKRAITRNRYKIYDFLFEFNRNYASILYRFRVIARFFAYVLYLMAMFPMTLGDPWPPKPPQFLHFGCLSYLRSE